MDGKNISRRRGFSIFSGWLLIVALLLNSGGVFAQSETTDTGGSATTFTLEDFGLAADDTYQGVLVSRDYGINLPAAWRYSEAAVLTLYFSHSPTLNPKSTLSVDWNGVRLGSQALTAGNAQAGSLAVQIPAENLTAGYNTLHVEFYMGISDDFCSDVDNPAVWATVHQASTLALAPRAAAPAAELSAFPLPFIDSSPVAQNRITLIVPAEPAFGELSALAAVSAKLGELTGGWRPLEVQVMSIPDALKNRPRGNLIAVAAAGSLKQLSAELAAVSAPAGSGTLHEQISPFDDSALLLAISGETQADVEKAGRALTGDSLYARLAGDTAVILDVPVDKSSGDSAGAAFTLEQLGYASTAVYGTRDQQTSYTIPLKALWQSNSSAALDLHFIHSALAAGERFTLTVAVNNLPVGSVVVTGGASSERRETFQIPLSFLKTGANYLTVQSSIQLSDDFNKDHNYCTDPHYNEAWLTIANDTQINFPSQPDKATANIANFPYEFIGAGDLSQLAFILPDAPGLADAQVMSTLAVRIGEIASGNLLQPQVLPAGEAPESDETYPYRLRSGVPVKNSAVLQAGSVLPQPFDLASGQALPVAGLATIDTSRTSTGYIQAYFAKKGLPRLVVSGNNENGMLGAAAHLGDAAKSILLTGDLAVTASDTLAASLWVEKGSETGAALSPAAQTQQTLSVWFQPSGVLYTALAVLIVTLVALILHVVTTFGKKNTDR
jgi:hypothetical protein